MYVLSCTHTHPESQIIHITCTHTHTRTDTHTQTDTHTDARKSTLTHALTQANTHCTNAQAIKHSTNVYTQRHEDTNNTIKRTIFPISYKLISHKGNMMNCQSDTWLGHRLSYYTNWLSWYTVRPKLWARQIQIFKVLTLIESNERMDWTANTVWYEITIRSMIMGRFLDHNSTRFKEMIEAREKLTKTKTNRTEILAQS